jgi:bifunctional non-homologous end joining protein LigD
VMMWDEGSYYAVPSDDPKEVAKALAKGHLNFILEGHKLKGEFSLVRLKDEKSWLLIKKKDKYAKDKNVFSEKSVVTKRSLEEIRDDDSMPHKIKPMLCTLIDKPFDDADWFYELKWDGYRAITELKNHKAAFYSRNHNSFRTMFPTIVEALEGIEGSAILDGEVVVVNDEGQPDFQMLQNYQKVQEGTPIYFLFDIIYFNGHDLQDLPLEMRKTVLKNLLKKHKGTPLYFSDHIVGQGIAFYEEASKRGLEGIIAKRSQSMYEQRRSKQWLKVKCGNRQEVIICGFTAPQKSRQSFGSLALGYYEDGALVYCGQVGTGFTTNSLSELYEKMQPLIQKECPFFKKPKGLKSPTWITPKLVCEVAFTEWTSDGSMRHPSFKGLRVDKKAEDVFREKPKG